MSSGASIQTYSDALEKIANDVIAPSAIDIDQTGSFPRASIDALGKAGLLGLISSAEVGGAGQGHRVAALTIERIARECASTAMITCMHYAGTAVIRSEE